MSPLDRFTCEEILRRLDDYVDRELAPSEMDLVKAHLLTCAECASEVGFQSALLEDARRKLRRIDVPDTLLAGVARRLAEAKALDEPK